MAIEQFVKHVEGLQHHHNRARSQERTQYANVAHLGSDLVKLKDMLKQALHHKNGQRR